MTKAISKVIINYPLAKRISAQQIQQAMEVVALDATQQVKLELSHPGTGREYPRGKDTTHVASAPGEPPAVDTGRLRNSITSEVFRTPKGAEVIVSANTEYAMALEVGTERIAPRPYMMTVLRQGVERWKGILKRFV